MNKQLIIQTSIIEESITFPENHIQNEIIADRKIRDIRRLFSAGNQKIIIEGSAGNGKTVLLMQFSKQNSFNTFSYFLSENYWITRQADFLRSLCKQMAKALNISSIKQLDDDENNKVEIEQLKTLFGSLNHKIIEMAKKEKKEFFFVVDGLEHAMGGNKGERIIDLLPPITNSRGVFFLGSIDSSIEEKLAFDYYSEDPYSFSITETEKFLAELNLKSNVIEKIQELSGGIPGIIITLRDLYLKENIPLESFSEKSMGFEVLCEIYWNKKFQDMSSHKKELLSLLAYSSVPLEEEIITKITGIATSEVHKTLIETGIVRQSSEGNYYYFPELYKKISQKMNISHKNLSLDALTLFYEKNSNLKDSKELLPGYYQEKEDFEAIQKLLDVSYLSTSVIETNDFGKTRRGLSSAIELAKKRNDPITLKYGLALSFINTLSNDLIGFSEINGLIALKRFENALELAYSIKLVTSRARSLSNIYLAMEKAGTTVPRASLKELEEIVNSIDVSPMQPKQLLDLATDLFPLMPDLAISFVEKAKVKESDRNPLELFALISSMSSDDPESEALINKIGNRELHDFALVNSPWLSRLTAKEVIKKGEQTTQLKAKEYLFRQWSLQNRNNPDIHLVLTAALDAINSDNFQISLRNLRQLSEPLINCNIEYRSLLISRFEIPESSSRKSPFDEYVRLELNIITALRELDTHQANERFLDLFSEIKQTVLDPDISTFCLAHLLISLDKLEIENKAEINKEIRTRLEDDFISFLSTSADQFEISKRILRVLPIVDPELALSFSDLLNTITRRDYGIQEVLVSYIRQDNRKIEENLLHIGINKINDSRIKEQTILRILNTAKDFDKFEQESVWGFALKSIRIIEDPIILCKAYACLLTEETLKHDKRLFEELSSNVKKTWEKIDILWLKVEVAFELSSKLAECESNCAEYFFELAKELRNSSPLANQSIGVIFYELLRTGSNIFGKLDISRESTIKQIEYFYKCIELLPSNLLQALIYAQIAITRLNCGDKNSFDSLIREKVILNLQNASSSELREKIISDLAVCLYKYSPQVAKTWVDSLPYSLRNFTWGQVAARIIMKADLFDEIDYESFNGSLDLANVNEVFEILDMIDRDVNIAIVGNLFCKAICNQANKFPEKQKIDFLVKLKDISTKKLPDKQNIIHNGYRVLLESQIEHAIRKVAKKTSAFYKKQHSQIITDAHSIENIADRVFVLSSIAKEFQENEPTIAINLLYESNNLISQIPNIKDKAGRLETIAQSFSKLNRTNEAIETINIVRKLAGSLEGIDRDVVLASIIQAAHQVDKDFGVQISDKIEDLSVKYEMQTSIASDDLSKSPQKLLSQYSQFFDDNEVLKRAAQKMNKSISNGRSVSLPANTITEWLYVTKNLDFDASIEIAEWAIAAEFQRIPNSSIPSFAEKTLSSIISSCELVYAIGNNIASLSVIPFDMRIGFQGLSAQKKFFTNNEREKAIVFLSDWLKTNVSEYVVICDPYFDKEQLWILQNIPSNIEVKIICSDKKFEFLPVVKEEIKKIEDFREKQKRIKREIEIILKNYWISISSQSPPRTFFVIHDSVFGTEEKENMHDRYLVSKFAGLGIGASLNSIGKNQSFISILTEEDLQYVQNEYIIPKLNIQENFSKVIYFELDE